MSMSTISMRSSPLLDDQGRETLHAVHDFMRKEVAPINDDWKPGSFPFEILPGLSN